MSRVDEVETLARRKIDVGEIAIFSTTAKDV